MEIFSNYRSVIQQIGGVLVIAMGLIMLGLFSPIWLMKERRWSLKNKPIGYVGSILVGFTSAAGWTLCVGPILASILTLAVTRPNQSVLYLTAYTVGFAIPFFIMAFFIGKIKSFMKYSVILMRIGGSMILTGLLLFTDQMTKITAFLIQLFGAFTGF